MYAFLFIMLHHCGFLRYLIFILSFGKVLFINALNTVPAFIFFGILIKRFFFNLCVLCVSLFLYFFYHFAYL